MTSPHGSLASLYIGNITCNITQLEWKSDGHLHRIWALAMTPWRSPASTNTYKTILNAPTYPCRVQPHSGPPHICTTRNALLATYSPLHPALHSSHPYVLIRSCTKICAISGWCFAQNKPYLAFIQKKSHPHNPPWKKTKTNTTCNIPQSIIYWMYCFLYAFNLCGQILFECCDGVAVIKFCNHYLNKLQNYSLTRWFQGNTVLNALPRGKSRRTTFVFVSIM